MPCTLGEPEACLLGKNSPLKGRHKCLPESGVSLPGIRVYDDTRRAVRNGRHKTFLYKLRVLSKTPTRMPAIQLFLPTIKNIFLEEKWEENTDVVTGIFMSGNCTVLLESMIILFPCWN